LALELNSGAYRIGRSQCNDFQIDHPSVSTAHCELRLMRGSLLVRDLDSTNGTFIDCQRIHEEALLFGQILQVGIVEFMLEEPLRLSAATAAVVEASPEVKAMESPFFHSCFHHPDLEAFFECPQCQHFYCASCVRGLSRMNGSKIKLCPDCACECERTGSLSAVQSLTAGRARAGSERALRAGLWPHLADWLKNKLVQGLLFQRRHLLEAQDLAARQAAEFDQRLEQVHFEMQERIHQYEQRIVDLEQELAAAELQKRELIRNQIILVKRALAEERDKEQFSARSTSTYSCGSARPGSVRPTPRNTYD